MRLFAYNKPKGEESAEAVFEGVKIYPACDIAAPAQGLEIYTDDKSAIEALRAVSAVCEIELHVDTDGPLSVPVIQKIRAGIEGVSDPCTASWTEANAAVIAISPCTKQIMDDIFAAVGRKVTFAKRYRVKNLKIKKTPLGGFTEYSEDEVKEFLGADL